MKNPIINLQTISCSSVEQSPDEIDSCECKSDISDQLADERFEVGKRLASWISHKINNPLAAIMGSAQLLSMRLQRDIDDQGKLENYLKYLSSIQRETERCAQVTGEILDFARIGNPSMRVVAVKEVLSEASDVVAHAFPGHIINSSIGENADTEITVDREWFTRVIFELVSNAITASGRLPVNIEVESFSTGKQAGNVNISIIDSGNGIPEDILGEVFHPFFSTNERSRGLGLTISREMLNKMGGTLEICNNADTGCTATIVLPSTEGVG